MADSDLAIVHGGGLIAARAMFPMAPEPWIDLSTGINPLPYPVPALRPEVYHRLPEPEEVRQLEAVAARAYGVADPHMVVAASGTQVLISLLPYLLRPGRVAIVGPTYAEHAAAWAAAGNAVSVVADPAALDGAPAAVLCNPNNPDGRRSYGAELAALARRVGVLIVDEAFADLEEPGLSLAPTLPSNAIVLRSFGKTYGLAGLRLGFALASLSMACTIRNALGPWAVSGAAVAFGTAALANAAWLDATRARLQADVARLDALLTQAGFRVAGGTLLFRLAQHVRAAAVFDRLGQSGILVRRFETEPSWLRFGIPGSGWDRLAAVLPSG
jgi:cobalamin biosynthetic protein CobC